MHLCFSQAKSLFHILACGRDSVVLDRLFRYGCTFAERAVTHSLCNAVTGRISKDPYEKSQFFVEGELVEYYEGFSVFVRVFLDDCCVLNFSLLV